MRPGQNILDIIVPEEVQRPAHRVPDQVGSQAAVKGPNTPFIPGDVAHDSYGAANAGGRGSVHWKGNKILACAYVYRVCKGETPCSRVFTISSGWTESVEVMPAVKPAIVSTSGLDNPCFSFIDLLCLVLTLRTRGLSRGVVESRGEAGSKILSEAPFTPRATGEHNFGCRLHIKLPRVEYLKILGHFESLGWARSM